jgi:hypothetical protein
MHLLRQICLDRAHPYRAASAHEPHNHCAAADAVLCCCGVYVLQGGCGTTDPSKSGDYVADTPAVKAANYKCVKVDSCANDNQGQDLIQSFMVVSRNNEQ